MLINVNNRVKQRNGQLRLASIKPQIFEVFVITKLNKLFRILPDRAEALKSFVHRLSREMEFLLHAAVQSGKEKTRLKPVLIWH